MKRILKNKIQWFCFGIGILVVTISPAFGPLLPYPDPTPELIEIYNKQVYKSEMILKIGLIITGISILSIIITRILNKKFKTNDS